MNNPTERMIAPASVTLIVVSALLGSHAMDIGQLAIALYDLWRPGSVDSKEEFRVEGGLLVAGAGFVVLLAIGARTAKRDGTTKGYETLLASLVTGFLGLTFSIIDKTTADTGLPTAATARGLIFVVIGACVMLPPFLAMPWTSLGLSRAATVLSRVAVAAISAFIIGLFVQGGYSLLAWVCTGPCEIRLEQGSLPLGDNHFYISAPSGAAFISGMAILICDPFVRKDRWPQFSVIGRTVWLSGFVAISCFLSALFALGHYYPTHGEANGHVGWLHSTSNFELFRLDTVKLLLALNLPALIGATINLTLVPKVQDHKCLGLQDFVRAVVAVVFGAGGAWFAVTLVEPLGALAGKELYFVGAHILTSLTVTLCAVAAYRLASVTQDEIEKS